MFPKALFGIGKVRCPEGSTQPKAYCTLPFSPLITEATQHNETPALRLAFTNILSSYKALFPVATISQTLRGKLIQQTKIHTQRIS